MAIIQVLCLGHPLHWVCYPWVNSVLCKQTFMRFFWPFVIFIFIGRVHIFRPRSCRSNSCNLIVSVPSWKRELPYWPWQNNVHATKNLGTEFLHILSLKPWLHTKRTHVNFREKFSPDISAVQAGFLGHTLDNNSVVNKIFGGEAARGPGGSGFETRATEKSFVWTSKAKGRYTYMLLGCVRALRTLGSLATGEGRSTKRKMKNEKQQPCGREVALESWRLVTAVKNNKEVRQGRTSAQTADRRMGGTPGREAHLMPGRMWLAQTSIDSSWGREAREAEAEKSVPSGCYSRQERKGKFFKN